MPSVSCPGCGANLKVPEGFAGRDAQCRKCNVQFKIPATSTATAPAKEKAAARSGTPRGNGTAPKRPAPPRQPAPPEDDHDEEELEERPRAKKRKKGKKKKKKSLPVLAISLIGGGAVLVIGLVILLIVLFNSPDSAKKSTSTATNDNPALVNDVQPGGNANPVVPQKSGWDLAAALPYMADGAEFIVGVNRTDLANSQIFTEVSEKVPLIKMGLDQDMDPNSPVDVKFTDFKTLVFSGTTEEETPVVLISFSDQATAQQTLKQMETHYTTETHGTRTLFSEGKGQKNSYFCFIDTDRILLGPKAKLKEILTRKGPAKLSPQLLKNLDKVNPSSTIVVLVDAEKLSKNPVLSENKDLPLESFPDLALLEITAAKELSAQARLFFSDTQKAKLIDSFVTVGLNQATKDLPPMATQMVQKLKSENKGTELVYNLQVNADTLASLASFIPMGPPQVIDEPLPNKGLPKTKPKGKPSLPKKKNPPVKPKKGGKSIPKTPEEDPFANPSKGNKGKTPPEEKRKDFDPFDPNTPPLSRLWRPSPRMIFVRNEDFLMG